MNEIKQFYSSVAWQRCREAYKRSVGGLCEECMKYGKISPATEVHHIRKLTKKTIHDPEITLSFKNLQALCSSCHEAKHKKIHENRRYTIDEYGRVTMKPE